MTCEIISVGTELLLGDITDTNAVYISREMAAMGISVLHRSTVGDNPERMEQTVRQALSRSDIVITSGGLGPTADDLTKEMCAEAMGAKLLLNEESKKRIENYFMHKGGDMPQSNLKQAYLPEGCTVFPNSRGTADGFALERDGKCVICLPGPPSEMLPMFEKSAKPYLMKKSECVIISHSVRTYGIGESLMAEKAAELLDGENPTVAPYAKQGEAMLRVTARGKTREEAEKLCKPVLEEIRSRLGEYIYGIDVESLEEAAVKMLRERGMTVGLAESCTGGYIAKRITDIPGSSEVFHCSAVTYANEIKEKLLGVPHEILREHGAVSREVACYMAAGARKMSGADIAVSVTGVAGPGGSEQKPAGLSFIALTDGKNTWCIRVQTGRDGEGARAYNRHVSASSALNLIRLYLTGSLEESEAEKDF